MSERDEYNPVSDEDIEELTEEDIEAIANILDGSTRRKYGEAILAMVGDANKSAALDFLEQLRQGHGRGAEEERDKE